MSAEKKFCGRFLYGVWGRSVGLWVVRIGLPLLLLRRWEGTRGEEGVEALAPSLPPDGDDDEVFKA